MQRFGAENGVTKLHTDPEALFSDPDIDIIDICTPNMYHAPLAIAALSAGKHVICEKPLAPTPEDVRQMIAARDASGKELMTAQHFRFQGSSRALKAEIDTGALGDIYHARSWMLRRAWGTGRRRVYSQGAQRRRPLHRHWGSHPRPDLMVYGAPRAGGHFGRGPR